MTLILLFKLALAVSMLVLGSVLQSADCQNAAAVTVVTTAETVAVAGVQCAVESNTAKAAVKALVVFSAGTNTTAVTLRLYRGATAAGTLISTATAQAGNFTVGSPASFVIGATDVLTNAAGTQYCVTVQATGASANGTISSATIDTMVLSG